MSARMPQISVVIPTCKRRLKLEATIRRLLDCRPPPAEILVHVDAGDTVTESWLRNEFSAVKTLNSSSRMGPGGGRNKLIAAAGSEIVASFDDDSYPIDEEYFARLFAVFNRRPNASVVASQIIHRGDPIPDAKADVCSTALFTGCGVAYRRQDFLDCGGYVPLSIAYGMEEVDLAMRLISQDKNIYFTPWLRVFHDTDLSHHESAAITAASIANLALLAYLRYPVHYWPYGALQVLNRVLWLIKAGRFRGIGGGLTGIPAYVWRHRRFRNTVSSSGLAAFLQARRSAATLEPLEARSKPSA